MAQFAFVKRFTGETDLHLPTRKTARSAGYDFEVAEDIVIPSYNLLYDIMKNAADIHALYNLDDISTLTKSLKAKPTLVPTGVKCYLPADKYLELSVRSSCPLKYWLVLANGVGIIDSDYADNPDNEGEIFFQVINFSPCDIILHKGDIIGQGIIKSYGVTDDDIAEGERLGGFGSTSNG